MQDKLYETTLALAGMVQAVFLVKELAQSGKTHEEAFSASLQSIFEMDPQNTAAVFGGIDGVQLGLKILLNTLEGKPEQGQPLLRYIMSLIHLEKKIRHIKPIQDHLKKRLTQTQKQIEYFGLIHPTVIANLADIYLQTISTFRFRIIVWGNPRLLGTAEIMERIRALLLAGIRSAVLWRQMGGSRLQLLFFRKKIKNMTKELLAQCSSKEYV